MFPGFTSRRTSPARCAASSADATCEMIAATRAGPSGPLWCITVRTSPPGTKRIAMNSTPLASPASNTGTMCGSSTAAAARDSRTNRCRNASSAASAGGALHAAIVKGSVVENQTGKALARSLVSIQPLPGSAGSTASVRTNTYGMFEFVDLPAGAYLIHAARRGFMTVQYGQKNWRAAGQPVVLEQAQSTFLSIRMNRFSSISGVIVDENDVGLPEHEVVAMTNTRPPRMLVKAQADDRGMFRISGLDPGAYLVRTLARAYEEGGYLPTFYRETARVDEAGMVDALLDQDTGSIRVRPLPGKLYTISGSVMTNPQGTVATVTLVSDVGRETVTTGATFQFVSKIGRAHV